MTLILGIDPGAAGAAALIRCRKTAEKPEMVELLALARLPMSQILALARRAALIVIEAQRAAPRQGAVSAFGLGYGYGRLQGGLEAVGGVRAVFPEPAVWRGAYGLPGGRGGGKASGLAMADALLGGYSGLKRHDEADAVLLAWWGWRNIVSRGS
jgi:hypothetical protein